MSRSDNKWAWWTNAILWNFEFNRVSQVYIIFGHSHPYYSGCRQPVKQTLNSVTVWVVCQQVSNENCMVYLPNITSIYFLWLTELIFTVSLQIMAYRRLGTRSLLTPPTCSWPYVCSFQLPFQCDEPLSPSLFAPSALLPFISTINSGSPWVNILLSKRSMITSWRFVLVVVGKGWYITKPLSARISSKNVVHYWYIRRPIRQLCMKFQNIKLHE